MHLASAPPILISQVQLQRFGAVAAMKGWGVWAEEGCVKLSQTVPPAFCSPELKEFLHNAIRQMKILTCFWTSLSQGSGVRIKDAFIRTVDQRRRWREKTLLVSHTTKKKRNSDEKKLYYFSFWRIVSQICILSVCLCLFFLTHFSSVHTVTFSTVGSKFRDVTTIQSHNLILRLWFSSSLFMFFAFSWLYWQDSFERWQDMGWVGGDDVQQMATGQTGTLCCCSEDKVSAYVLHTWPAELLGHWQSCIVRLSSLDL